MYVNELKVRYRRRRVPGWALSEGRLRAPLEAAKILLPLLQREIVEVCGMLCLTSTLDVLAYHEVSRGTIHTTVVHPRDVFRTALLANAAAVVVAHNHPSGDVTPSHDDEVLTTRLRTAGEMIGVDLADHLIVSVDGRYYSFRERTIGGLT